MPVQRPPGEAARPLAGAGSQLRRDDPRLVELCCQYEQIVSPFATHSLWTPTDRRADIDLANFRADNAYLWQLRNVRARAGSRYLRYARYLHERDSQGLFDILTEDGAFGAWTVRSRSLPPFSRDLLDSINELYFLDRTWALFDQPGFSVVDIGAGYGRLAHRMAAAVPALTRYYCVDAVPESTFLSEYYLRYRQVAKATVVALNEINHLFHGVRPDLAVNIHSFTEMPYSAVRAWVSWLSGLRIPRLLVVVNLYGLVSSEMDGSRRDCLPLLSMYGYRLSAREPTVHDAKLRSIIGFQNHFLLFELAYPLSDAPTSAAGTNPHVG
jgi:hypothetical protein